MTHSPTVWATSKKKILRLNITQDSKFQFENLSLKKKKKFPQCSSSNQLGNAILPLQKFKTYCYVIV